MPILTIGGIIGTAIALGVTAFNLAVALGKAASKSVRTPKPEYVAAHEHSKNHREQIIRSKQCGCFYCLSIFEPAAIVDWIDETVAGIGATALCPRCGIDSVVGAASGYPITLSFLEEMRQYWFVEKQAHSALS